MHARSTPVPALLITAAAILAAVLACLAASKINIAYYRSHAFIGDTSSFFYVQFKLYFDSSTSSKFQVVWAQFLNDPKNPLGYLPYLFFPRNFLLSMNSHLVFTGLSFFSFSALLGWAVYQRTGSAVYAAAAPFLIFCAEGFFDPIYQFPSKLSDPPAAFVFGSAMLCVMNSRQGRSLAWLAGFGLFAGLALLSRFTSSAYLFFVCAPVLTLYLALRARDPEYGWSHVVRAVTVIAIPLVAVAGWHFATHVRGVLFFYSVAGYSINQSLLNALELTLFKFIVNYVGGLGMALPVLIGGLYTAIFWRRRADLWDLATTVWMAIAVPLLLVVILRINDDAPQLAFGLAGYLLLALAPFPLRLSTEQDRRRMTAFGVVVGASLLPATAYAMVARPYIVYVGKTNSLDLQLVPANRQMAEYAFVRQREQMREQVIDASFDYQWRHLQPTALYAFGILLRTERQFEIRQEQWALRYGNKDPQEIGRLLATNYNDKTDILYLIAEPTSEKSRPIMKDDFTAAVGQEIVNWVRNAPGWTKLGTVDYPWGAVDVWANGNRW